MIGIVSDIPNKDMLLLALCSDVLVRIISSQAHGMKPTVATNFPT